MKKTMKSNKLMLRLDTVRVLTSQDLILVAGGVCKTVSNLSNTKPPAVQGSPVGVIPRPKTC